MQNESLVYRQLLWLTRTFSTEALIRESQRILQSTGHRVHLLRTNTK